MERSDWRNIFCRQPVHFLLFDVSIPMTFDIVKKVCETLEQLFSLDISLKGSSRLSSFGLTVLGNSANCIFPLQQVKPNFQILPSALEEVLILYQEAASFGNVFNYDILMHAFQEAIDQYNRLRQLQNVQTIKEGTPQLQITLLSCKNSHVLIPCIDSVTSSLDLTFIRKIEVLSISNLCSAFSNDGQENSVNKRLEGTNLDSPNIHQKDQAHSASSETVESLSGGVVEFLTLNFDPYSVENFFKKWLHDVNTDTESVRLIFSGGELSEQFIIKCDAQE
ncbi:meiosis 1 arrest protein-like [Tachypleus tridentatus]|uniref:meiosis 1 arrest protein-like n=1 Tax=Tachypleus tridentatus TaxID=6853 RepID=UPI003FD5905F